MRMTAAFAVFEKVKTLPNSLTGFILSMFNAKDQPESPDSAPNSQDLERKMKEMQNRITVLEDELKEAQSSKSARKQINLTALASLIIVTLLALIPPALVVAERWLYILPRYFIQDTWCLSDFLCHTMWPPYFLIVFACYLLLFVILFTQHARPQVIIEEPLQPLDADVVKKRQTDVGRFYILASICGFIYIVIRSLIVQELPGWSLVYAWLAFMLGCFLVSIRPDRITGFWRSQGEFWLSILILHISIVAVIAGIYAHPDMFWATLVLLCLAAANIWRFRRRVPVIFWIMSLALIVYSINLTGWWTAAVGDEYGFPEAARQLAEKTSFIELGSFLFRADGVAGTHPYFSSILQAIFMKFFGHDNFGWRFSNPYMCSLAVGLFSFFCKSFLPKKTSLIAAFLLGVSSYIMAFSKIGYNNLQALFAMTLVLAVSALVLQYKTMLSYACLGSVLAFCFYVYPAALYAPPLALFLFLIYEPPVTSERWKRWMTVILVTAALLFPLMMQPAYAQSKIPGTFFNQPLIFESETSLWNHFVTNLLYSIFSFLYIASESHYLAASYLDPLSSALFVIGFILLLYQMRRKKFPVFFLVTFIYLVIFVGATHDRQAPPNTRMFMLLPVFTLAAAWGLVWLEEKYIEALSPKVTQRRIAAGILLAGITFLNIYQAYQVSHYRFPNMQNAEALFIRITENIYKAEPGVPRTYVFVVDPSWGISGPVMLQKLYPHLAWAQIKQLTLTEPEIPKESIPLLEDRNTFILFMPWMNVEWKTRLDPQIRALGKEVCQITAYNGDPRFPLYYPPDLPQGCKP